MPDRRTAWLCLRESVRDFRLHEWMPFGWLLALQLLFLLCAVNLQTTWGMAVAGWITERAGGDRLLHYPYFYIALPSVASMVEWFVYLFPGCVFVPLALLRVSEPAENASAVEDRSVRLRRAVLPTLVAAALNVALLQGWQWVGGKFVLPTIGSYLPGVPGQIVAWVLMVFVSYLVSVPFLYVPVRGVQPNASFAGALGGGLAEGVRLLLPTTLVVVIASCVALPFLAPVQLSAQVIVGKMRPEIVPLLLAIYAVITSAANYIIYASAMRLHWARQS